MLFGGLTGISANVYIIDAIIGLSVIYKALDNLVALQRWFGFQPNTKWATLIFGLSDRTVMLSAASAMTVALAALALSWQDHALSHYWGVILVGWLVLGIAYSANITPGGRLLRRSSGEQDRPALFAAQFALSHLCRLIAYPLARQIGAFGGMGAALGAAATLALVGTVIAFRIWPVEDPEVLAHTHDDLPPDHPHLVEEHPEGRSGHAFVIDDLHPHWPTR